jgi:hypothetical protein
VKKVVSRRTRHVVKTQRSNFLEKRLAAD